MSFEFVDDHELTLCCQKFYTPVVTCPNTSTHGVLNAPVTIALPLQVYFLLTLTMQMSTPLNRT